MKGAAPELLDVVRRLLAVAVSCLLLIGGLAAADVRADRRPAARISPELIAAFSQRPAEPLVAFVHAVDVVAARGAAVAAGLRVVTSFDAVGAVAVIGPAAALETVAADPEVTYVEADRSLELMMETSHVATRTVQARQGFTYTYDEAQPDRPGEPRRVCKGKGRRQRCRTEPGPPVAQPPVRRTGSSPGVDGSGVGIAVVDSGIDGTHPMFQVAGRSKVVRNLRVACVLTIEDCLGTAGDFREEMVVDVPGNNSELTLVGHGTHVAGTAAGVDVVTRDGRRLVGAAPGASLVGISVGAGLSVMGFALALNWILEHHDQPCGTGVAGCPRIRVVNNSYGAPGEFDPDSIVTKIQRGLIAEGVVMVWSAGNSGGDGLSSRTNSLGQDPTPGSIMVANYWDHDNGSREGSLHSTSSRGEFRRPETYPDVSAPGTNIVSACRAAFAACQVLPIGKDVAAGADPDYAANYGTSMAAPHVTGIVAQMLEAEPNLTPAQVEEILEDTAHPFPFGGRYEQDPANRDHAISYDKGHGLVDATNAVTIARKLPGWAPDGVSCTPSEPVSHDPAGDAKGIGFLPLASHDPFLQVAAAPSDPALDLRRTFASFDGDALRFDIGVADLQEEDSPATTGTVVDLDFRRRGSLLRVHMTRSGGEAEADLTEQGEGVIAEGLPVTFDAGTDTISVSIPGAAAAATKAGRWAGGEVIVLEDVATRRLHGGLLTMADGAGPYCAYRLGSGAVTEAPPGSNLGPDPTRSKAPPPGPAETTVHRGGSHAWEGGPLTAVEADGTCDGIRVGHGCEVRFIGLVPGGDARLEIEVVPENPLHDIDLYVYDPSGNEIARSAMPVVVADPDSAERISVVVSEAGVYRIVVNPYATVDMVYSGSLRLG